MFPCSLEYVFGLVGHIQGQGQRQPGLHISPLLLVGSENRVMSNLFHDMVGQPAQTQIGDGLD